MFNQYVYKAVNKIELKTLTYIPNVFTMSYITFLTVYHASLTKLYYNVLFETKMSIITFICDSFSYLKPLHITFYKGKKVFI